MRIALCGEFPLVADRVVGGIEEVARRLAGAMVAQGGLEVHAVSFHAGLSAPRAEEIDGVTVHRFPMPDRFGNVTLGRAERRRTEQALRRIAPDVAHPLGLGAKALGAADSGRPWVVSVNGITSVEARTKGGVRNRARAWAVARLERASLAAATDVIVPNEVVRGLLQDRLGAGRVHRIENAVDEAFFGLPRRPEAGRIVCVGRILPLKAPEDLIEAAHRMIARGESVRVRFVGPPDDPAYLDRLRSRVRELGLESCVEFLGFVSDADLREELVAAAVLAHPSRVEVAPLAVMQAMAAGLPVVATDVGGTRHLVAEGRTGLLVSAGRPGELAEALARVLARPEEARAMGEEGRAEAEQRFRITRVVERTLAVYRGCLEASQRSESTGWSRHNSLQFQQITPDAESVETPDSRREGHP